MRMKEETFQRYIEDPGRLRLISRVNLMRLSQELVEIVMSMLADTEEFRIREIRLNWSNSLSSALQRALVKIEDVNLRSRFLDFRPAVESLEALCVEIVKCEKLKMKKLKLRIRTYDSKDTDCPSASPEALSGAVVRLEQVEFGFIMNQQQIMAIADRIRTEKELKLRSLQLPMRCEVDSIPPQLLAEALIRLERIPQNLNFSEQQIFYLLRSVQESREGELRLKTLVLFRRDLSSCGNVLSEAIVKLETVILTDSRLSRKQRKVLLKKIARAENLKTKFLELGNINLSNVPVNDLLKGFSRVRLGKLSKIIY